MTRAPDPATFRQAAQVIETGGLEKKRYGPVNRMDRPHCTVGALYAAHGNMTVSIHPEVAYLAEMLGVAGVAGPVCGCCGVQGNAIGQIANWNDADETTQQDVVDLLTQAAQKLEADR